MTTRRRAMTNQLHRIITTTMNKSLSLLLYSLFLLFAMIIRFDDVSALTSFTTPITTTRTRTRIRPLKSAATALFLQGGGKIDYDDTNKTNEIPDIEIFRNEIRKWSRVRSSRSGASSSTQAVEEAPNEAAKALREMFRYYNPSNNKSQYEEVGKRSENNNNMSSSSSSSSSSMNSRQRRQTVDAIDCNQVINAWSNSYQKDAPQQAVSILKSMATMYENNNNDNNNISEDSSSNYDSYACIRPDVFTYTSVINAFSKRGDYDEAMKIFKIQMNDYKNKNNLSAKVRFFITL